MNTKLSFQFAGPEDIEEIRNLLKTAELPYEDIQSGTGHFLIVRQQHQLLAGCVGLQICGENALLRSLVVDQAERTQGLGKSLTQEILEYASRLNLRKIFLLTTTAEGFFAKFGFIKTDRKHTPEEISKTSEFSSLCPSTAVLMRKELKQ